MTTVIIIIESALIVALLLACIFLNLHRKLSNEMLNSKDQMILHCKAQLREKDTFLLSKLLKIQELLKKE